MLDKDDQDVLWELFEEYYKLIAEKIQYKEVLYPPLAFMELCSAINTCYLDYTLSPSQFVELLELYIEFFKEKTLGAQKSEWL